jgi:hypothetical protein
MHKCFNCVNLESCSIEHTQDCEFFTDWEEAKSDDPFMVEYERFVNTMM